MPSSHDTDDVTQAPSSGGTPRRLGSLVCPQEVCALTDLKPMGSLLDMKQTCCACSPKEMSVDNICH
jgi:hypothetical protein